MIALIGAHSVKRRESFYTASRSKVNTAPRRSHRFFPPTKGMVAACFIHDANWRSSKSSTDANSTPRVDLPIPIGVTGGSGLIAVPRMNV